MIVAEDQEGASLLNNIQSDNFVLLVVHHLLYGLQQFKDSPSFSLTTFKSKSVKRVTTVCVCAVNEH